MAIIAMESERIALVDKFFYAKLIESLDMMERIVSIPPERLWTDTLRAAVDERFPHGIRLISSTPEGPRVIYFMKKKD